MQIGLVGLQYSGKTTLFSSLSQSERNNEYANVDEAVIEVVKVPDERLDKLTEMFNPKKKVNAVIEVFDFPGLRMGDDGKVKITSGFLNNVKTNDALFYVVRQFADDTVHHPLGNVDPLRDINYLEEEFLLSDLSFLEGRIEKLKKDVMKIKDDSLAKDLKIIEKCYEHASEEKPLRTLELDADEFKRLSGFQLLTLKPLAIAVNLGEESIADADAIAEEIKTKTAHIGADVIPFSAQIESELSDLDEEDKIEFMNDYGITESALNKILRTSYELLGLQAFFTVGEDECRAWTIKKNYTAPEAAGVIHTDFYNKFIRAEVVHYNDYIEYGSMSKCKDAGVWRLEGKDYIVKDGDIINVRHS